MRPSNVLGDEHDIVQDSFDEFQHKEHKFKGTTMNGIKNGAVALNIFRYT